MAMLNFSTRFASDVEAGIKRQTIRKRWKRPIRVGRRLILATGARTKQYRRLSGPGKPVQWPVAKAVIRIKIEKWTYIAGMSGEQTLHRIEVDHRVLGSRQSLELARNDGFASIKEFIDWFEHLYGLPFRGVMIRW